MLVAAVWSFAGTVEPSDGIHAIDRSAATAAVSRPTSSALDASPAVPPGLRRNVQRWVTARDRPLIRMNNALVPIVLGTIRSVGPESVECRRLDRSVRSVRGVGRSPHARVNKLATAGLADIQRAARACLAGDRQGTRRHAKVGLAKRAAVSLELDEALEGE
jgi:hypothetical protein